ncbi:hypothetical protein OE88DRAFT_807286 [Heliocybe sulcata]|uniref:Uncharacterized protein n=1 Tax=Heliocybe sulcata TaxID=5364 RepID=A0A5C3MUL2_9AGAM|nr:hypothetical protein OE88DRAFT_807286 [Heliocybe sulcata]
MFLILDLGREMSRWLSEAPAVDSPSPFLSFRGLTSFNLNANVFDEGQDSPGAVPLLRMLIDNCPDLRSLTLHLEMYQHMETVSADLLLQHPDWVNLHTLYLEGFHCTSCRVMTGRMWYSRTALFQIYVDWSAAATRRQRCSRTHEPQTVLHPFEEDELNVDSYFNYASDDEWWGAHPDDDHDFETRTGRRRCWRVFGYTL